MCGDRKGVVSIRRPSYPRARALSLFPLRSFSRRTEHPQGQSAAAGAGADDADEAGRDPPDRHRCVPCSLLLLTCNRLIPSPHSFTFSTPPQPQPTVRRAVVRPHAAAAPGPAAPLHVHAGAPPSARPEADEGGAVQPGGGAAALECVGLLGVCFDGVAGGMGGWRMDDRSIDRSTD